MEYIVSVVIITASIVSVNRNYEKIKRQRTGGKCPPDYHRLYDPHSPQGGAFGGYKAANRLSVGFCERVVYLFNLCARVNFVTAAGYRVPMRADEIRALSCITLRSSRKNGYKDQR
jgi:hypothetical protein